jgi:hypothetical protein
VGDPQEHLQKLEKHLKNCKMFRVL